MWNPIIIHCPWHISDGIKVTYGRKWAKMAVVKYLQPKEPTMQTWCHLGDDAPSFATVKRWAVEFLTVKKKSSTVTANENIDKIHDLIMDVQRLPTRHIANTGGILLGRVENILNHELDTTKAP